MVLAKLWQSQSSPLSSGFGIRSMEKSIQLHVERARLQSDRLMAPPDHRASAAVPRDRLVMKSSSALRCKRQNSLWFAKEPDRIIVKNLPLLLIRKVLPLNSVIA